MAFICTIVPAFIKLRREALSALAARAVLVSLAMAMPTVVSAQSCKGTLYFTFDTGNMRHAELIASTLNKHQVKATFFLANEAVYPDKKRMALDSSFTEYWRARVAEGHQFGSHTWRHGVFLQDTSSGVSYRPQFGEQQGKVVSLTSAAVCSELNAVKSRFQEMTGQTLAPLWRAPGGKTTALTVKAAQQCGYRHVHWASAGFLGDELSSEKFPNQMLLDRALRDLRDGDIVMAHLGIWSRKDPFAPMLDPLLAGLKAKGFCFATLRS